jgi:hypothetical protein
MFVLGWVAHATLTQLIARDFAGAAICALCAVWMGYILCVNGHFAR